MTIAPSLTAAPLIVPAADQRGQVYDRLAISLLVLCGVGAAFVFRDYGLGWDDYTHSEYGDLLVAFYTSGFSDRRALSFVNLYMYGGGFDVVAALAAKISPFTLFETRRLLGAAVGLLGLFATWRTARHIARPLAGLVALVLLAACPLFVGHLFMNAKDGPFAVAMAILLLALVRVCADYPHASPATAALLGLGLGVSLGSRVMGGFGVIYAVAGIMLIVASEARAIGWRVAASRFGGFVVSILPALLAGYAVMALVWPWAAIDPLNPFRAAEYFSHFFEKPWQELFGGERIRVVDMPRSYLPTLLALQLPEIFGVLALAGSVGAVILLFRRGETANRRAAMLVVLLAALLPILITVAARPAMYNGIRHFVFLLPPLAVLGGLAGAWVIATLGRRWRSVAMAATAAIAIGVALPALEMIRLHPYEYTYFNRLAGGVQGAQRQYMLDYWGLAFKQASDSLLARLAERHETKPQGRPWKIATCGPHRPAQVALGRDFEPSWDPVNADFAMMLGVFYCATFDAPVLVEIKRDGVVYARIYDIRGRSYPSLLTVPEP